MTEQERGPGPTDSRRDRPPHADRRGRKAPRPGRLTRASARAWRERWDRQQERLIPGREERFDALLDALGRAVGPRFRALDLGCGTGSLTERVLDRFPRSRVVAVDFDPITLRLARTALGDLAGRVTWVDADLRRRDWPRALPPGKFDAAVATTSLHWLAPDELGRLYFDLGRLVRRGGVFLNGDALGYALQSVRLTKMARSAGREWLRSSSRGETWRAWWRSALSDAALAPEAALHRERFPRRHDTTPTPDLAGHVRRLRDAGFREVELVWSRWRNRVLAAVR